LPLLNLSGSGTPAATNLNDGVPIEVGVQFTSDVAGYVTGLQFYKGSSDTGPHTGHLWDASGNLLVTVTFISETASGWQQAYFSNGVAVQANTTYVVSYLSPTGYYADTQNYFTQQTDVPPLHAPISAGVFQELASTTTPSFPNSSFNNSNYWVDVIFSVTPPPPVAPAIVNQPASQEIASGKTATLSVVATGTAPLNYQWYQGSTGDISTPVGSNSATFITPTLSAQTSYWVQVTNAGGSTNSATATISIAVPTLRDTSMSDFAAGNGTCRVVPFPNGAGVILAPTVDVEFSGTALPNDWVSNLWTPSGSAVVTDGLVTIDGASIATNVGYPQGTALDFIATFSGAQFQHAGFVNDVLFNTPWMLFTTSNGNALYAFIYGQPLVAIPGNWLGAPHRFRIAWNAGSVVFSVDGSVVPAQNVMVPGNLVLGASDLNAGDGSLLINEMRVSPYASQCTFTSRVLDSGSSATWSNISWITDNPPNTSLSFSYRTGDTPVPDATWSSFTGIPSSGSPITGSSRYIQYAAALASSDPTATPALESVTIAYTQNRAPVITAQPAGKTINSGQTATLSVTATGPAPLSYQWYQGTSDTTTTPVGSNSPTFTTPALTTTTSYWVRVTAATGLTANSVTATITVNQPPVITAQPVSRTINSGQTASLSVTATGSPAPLSYQWYRGLSGNMTTPVGGNSSSFTTPTLTLTTSYWVQVSTAAGVSVNSTTATITVSQYPVIETQPMSQTIAIGKTATLTVSATGPAPLRYQWYLGTTGNRTLPVGTNSPTFTTPALFYSTNYWVLVTSPAGLTASSTTAKITVAQPPVILTQPASYYIWPRQQVVLQVYATGGYGLTYQWFQGSSGDVSHPIQGANAYYFITPPLTVTTKYWVKVGNSSGLTTNSVTATIWVF
jgi:hypothetical protein